MDIKNIFSGNAPGAPGGDKAAAKPMPVRKAGAAPSIISADLQIVGDLTSTGDLQVDGAVQGDIRSIALTIGESAQVRGGVMAESVRVCGSVIGQIEARRVELTKTARVTGDILHELLAIESGAYLEGNCRRLDEPRGGAVEPRRDGVVNLASAVPNPLSKKGGAA